MRTEEMILVSIDDHLIEPAGVFEHHIPESFRDRVPKMVRDDNGVDRWVSEIDAFIVLAAQVSTIALTDLIFGPTLRRFPVLRVALSEGGIGWIPFYLERADRHYRNQIWTGVRENRLPSELFRDQVLACFITDPAGLKLRNEIRIDNIAWECDYPHSDSTWPTAAADVMAEFTDTGCSDADIDQIGWQNSCRFFGIDVADVDRDEVSVGALQKKGADVDTSLVSRNEWRERYELAEQSAP